MSPPPARKSSSPTFAPHGPGSSSTTCTTPPRSSRNRCIYRAHIEALRRELAGVEHRLEHLDDPVLAFQEPPSREHLERERTSLENTKAVILAELERLDAATVERAKREPKPRRSAKTTT